MASAAEETANKFNVIFEGAQDVSGAIQKLNKDTGYATSSLQEMASGIGALVKPVGFSAEKTFELSKRITALSLDIGSFMNLAPQEVVLNFQSALAGSSETLQKYGIDARETTLAQQAFNMGLISSVKEYEKLDPEEKRRVRTLALIEKSFKDTQSAQGDLARTQDTYANVSRTTDEKYKEFGETLGEILEPKLKAVKILFGEGAEAATNFLKAITETPSEKTAAEKQIEFLKEYAKGYKAQKEVEAIANNKVTDLLKTNFDYQVQFNSATGERSKILEDQVLLAQESYRLGNEEITNASDLFSSEYQIKNILESQLGTRELNLDNIDKAVQKLSEVKAAEEKIDQLTKSTAESNDKIVESKEKAKSIDEYVLKLAQQAQANIHYMKTDWDALEAIQKESELTVASYGDKISKATNDAIRLGTGMQTVNLRTKETKEQARQLSDWLANSLYNVAAMVDILNQKKFSISGLFKIASLVAGIIPGGQAFAPIFAGAGQVAGSMGFQHGGSFIVPGSGSPDSKMVSFRATPGEQVTVTKPGQTINNSPIFNISVQANNFDDTFVRAKLIPMIRDAQRNFGARI